MRILGTPEDKRHAMLSRLGEPIRIERRSILDVVRDTGRVESRSMMAMSWAEQRQRQILQLIDAGIKAANRPDDGAWQPGQRRPRSFLVAQRSARMSIHPNGPMCHASSQAQDVVRIICRAMHGLFFVSGWGSGWNW